jgi:hypothetical protein
MTSQHTLQADPICVNNEVYKALLDLQKGRVKTNPNYALCNTLQLVCGIKEPNIPLKALKRWEHFSGNELYPVEGSPNLFADQVDKWDPENNYGWLRWDLVNHLIIDYRGCQEILRALQQLKKEGPQKNWCGICTNVRRLIGEDEDGENEYRDYASEACSYAYYKLDTILIDLFKSWKHYSGNENYPIEGSVEKYDSSDNKWATTTKYGRLRHQLLNHAIRELSNALR